MRCGRSSDLIVARWAQPGYVATKSGKSWFADEEFFRAYDRLMPADERRSAERKYFLRSLLALADGLPGDTAECGVFTGASSWFICRHFVGSGIHPVLRVQTALLAAGSAIVVGLVFGTYPARRAARLSPVDAIARE